MTPVFAHLQKAIMPGDRCADVIADEARSIEANDILGWQVDGAGYCEDEENPFARYLQECSEALPTLVKLEDFSVDRTRYEVCRDDVQALTANDELLTKLLIDGDIPLHEMPRDLFDFNKVEQRLEWFRTYLIDRIRDGWIPPMRIPVSVLETDTREELCEWFRSKLDASKAATTKQHRAVAPLVVVTSTTVSGGEDE
jgi:hypothetical protein